MPRFGELNAPWQSYHYGGIYWHTFFESYDGYDAATVGAGSGVAINGGELTLTAGNVATDYAYVFKYPEHHALLNQPDWTRRRRFRISVHRFGVTTEQEIYIVTGGIGTFRHVGFKVVDDTLYGCAADGAAESTVALMAIAALTEYVLECVFFPNNRADFYVDGVLLGSLTANLPSGAPYANYMLFLAVTVGAGIGGQKSLSVCEYHFLQEP